MYFESFERKFYFKTESGSNILLLHLTLLMTAPAVLSGYHWMAEIQHWLTL